jgi:hypothetical protein
MLNLRLNSLIKSIVVAKLTNDTMILSLLMVLCKLKNSLKSSSTPNILLNSRFKQKINMHPKINIEAIKPMRSISLSHHFLDLYLS